MLLEVGMNIYCTGGFGINKYTITRVTAKRAFVKISESNEISFKRECKNGNFLYRIGSDTWSRSKYALETPELIEKHKRYCLEEKVGGIKVKELTNSQLQRIVEIINEPEQST